VLANFIAAVRNTGASWARACGHAVKRLAEPARSAATATAGVARDSVRSRTELLAENALLRQQLIVLRRSVKRPALGRADRLAVVVLARLSSAWRDALHLVQPDTLLRWHRELFKTVWRRKSRPKRQPKRLAQETINLIKEIAASNATWGAERIRGELLKLRLRVSKRAIQKYMKEVRPPGKPSQTWETFLQNHTNDIWACDFLQLYNAWFRPIFAFFVVKHGTREVVHFNVTRSPSDTWAAQQLREAIPWGEGPRFLIRDNDGKYGLKFAAVAEGAGIDVVSIPPRSPNLTPICERFLGSVRRECLDHIVILGEDHLRRVLEEYVHAYFNVARPHQGLGQRIPGTIGRPPDEPTVGGDIVATPILGGLHHDYRWAA
jgi:transposase InsO family protein